MSGYKFVEFGYCQLSVNHIPYLVYSAVKGPRGGQYLLDEFNTESLMKGLVDIRYASIIIQVRDKFIKRLTRDTVVRNIYSNVTTDNIKRLAAENSQRFLERKAGVTITNRIAGAFNKEQTQILNDVCIETVHNLLHNIK